MTPVYQTIFEKGNGNCLQACIASVLDKSLEEIPHIGKNENWFPIIAEWCQKNNYAILYIEANDSKTLLINCYPILIYNVHNHSETHAVVGKLNLYKNKVDWEWSSEILFNPNNKNNHMLTELVGTLIIFDKGKEFNE